MRCAADISKRHGRARYCAACSVFATFASFAASKKVCKAIKAGDLPHPRTLACVDCGGAAEVYDHRDYAQPLHVAAVCERCNIRRGPAIWRTDPAIAAEVA